MRAGAFRLVVAAFIAAVSCGAATARAANRPAQPAAERKAGESAQITGKEITPQQQLAVERGLAYLAGRQARNGGYGAGMAYGGGQGGHAGITGLAGLAFMAAGNLPSRGKYGENVQKLLEFLLASTQESGLISSDQSHGVMYGHGFALLFLAEVYGMSPDDQVKEKLQKAVQLTMKTQNKEGGWRYQPWPYDADISVTITQIMGLRAARDAGIKVEEQVMVKALEYIKRCQNKDGGFSYMANQGGGMGGSGFARTGAGLASLYYGRIKASDFAQEIESGLKYMRNFTPGKGGAVDAEGHFYYGHYYAVQAMFMAGGDYWANWYPSIRDVLIQRQNKQNGGWSGEAGEDYATAMALIILQMPNRYLPVYHGKGIE